MRRPGQQGFLAVAPDIFCRQEPVIELSVTSEPHWQHGLRLYQAYDRDAGAKDVQDTVRRALVARRMALQHAKPGRLVLIEPAKTQQPVKIAMLWHKKTAGQGIAQSVEFGLEPLLANKTIVQILPNWAEERYGLYSYHPSRHLTPVKVRAFLDFLKESMPAQRR